METTRLAVSDAGIATPSIAAGLIDWTAWKKRAVYRGGPIFEAETGDKAFAPSRRLLELAESGESFTGAG